MASFKQEVLNLIEEFEVGVQRMREDGDTDLRTVIYKARDLYASIARLEEDGEYHNG